MEPFLLSLISEEGANLEKSGIWLGRGREKSTVSMTLLQLRTCSSYSLSQGFWVSNHADHIYRQYLTQEGWVAPGKVAINGASNGGLLVAACLNRAPSGTFGAGVAEVGVHDMLKVHDTPHYFSNILNFLLSVCRFYDWKGVDSRLRRPSRR